MKGVLEKMASVNQTTSVYMDLKDKILKGNYSPAESLPEIELAAHYGVSRNTIKKSLLMLENESLVTIEQNKGAKVRSYSMEEVLEFLELRCVLEGFIIRLSVQNFTDEHLTRLEEMLATMRQDKDEHNLLAYSTDNQEFHKIIYEACPNRTAVDMTVSLKNQMSKYNTKTILIPGRDVQSYSEHSAILDAIKNHDADLADILMRHHISNVKKTFEENFKLLF